MGEGRVSDSESPALIRLPIWSTKNEVHKASMKYINRVFFSIELQLTNFSSILEPDKIQNLHCRPQTSTAIACSWAPPDSDFDGYNIECKKMDTGEIAFSKRIEKEKSLFNIMTLVPHKRYMVSIRVHSSDMTSEVVEDSTITMIDRKSFVYA